MQVVSRHAITSVGICLLTTLGGCEESAPEALTDPAFGGTFVQPTMDADEPSNIGEPISEVADESSHTEKESAPSIAADETFNVNDFNVISNYKYAHVSSESEPINTEWLPGWFESSNLPVLIVDTHGLSIKDEPKQPATLTVWNSESTRNNPDRLPTATHTIGIEKRGQTSQFFPKVGFGVETWEPYTHKGTDGFLDKDISLLGLPEEEDWVFYGPYYDNSLMRNAIAYTLGGSVTGQYTPRHRYVELFVSNDSTDPLRFDNYYGVYLVTEKIKRDDNRVDISKRSYLFEMTPDEKLDKHDIWIYHRPHYFTIKYPKNPEKADPGVITQLDSIVCDLNAAMYSKNFDDAQQGFLAYMDLDSFADFILLNEYLKNRDGFYASTYLTWAPGEKIKAGPLWDFNTAMARTGDDSFDQAEGWMLPLRDTWARRMMQSEVFTQRMADRWHELRHGPLSNAQIVRLVETYRVELSEAQERNFEAFPETLGKDIYPYEATWGDAVDRLEDWLLDRADWLDRNIDDGLPFFYEPPPDSSDE